MSRPVGWAIAAFVLILVGSAASAAEQPRRFSGVAIPADLAASKQLTVGINCSYPPAGYVDLGGKPTGYEVALVRLIAEFAFGTGDGLKTQCMNDSNRIPFLQSGKVDFVLAALAWTPARAEQIGFSDPIWVSNLQLVVPNASTISNYGDLVGKTVVTTTGSLYQNWIQRCYPKANLITVQSPADASSALMQGRADAMGYIDVYAFNFSQQNKTFKLVGTLASPAVQGIGVKKENTELLAWLNAVLKQLREEDAFFKAFADEVKDPTFTAKYRQSVPGPSLELKYANSAAADCKE